MRQNNSRGGESTRDRERREEDRIRNGYIEVNQGSVCAYEEDVK